MKAEDAVMALSALAQEHRLAVFRLLVVKGPEGMAAGALAKALDISPSSMSFHLSQLQNAGLVTQRRKSRSIIYSASYSSMNDLIDYLGDNCCADSPDPAAAAAANCCSPRKPFPSC